MTTTTRLQQGLLLNTEFTRRMTDAERARAHARERCMIFTNFSALDEGRSRELVAQVHTSEDDARRLVTCWNACQGLSLEELSRPVSSQVGRLRQIQANAHALLDHQLRQALHHLDRVLNENRTATQALEYEREARNFLHGLGR